MESGRPNRREVLKAAAVLPIAATTATGQEPPATAPEARPQSATEALRRLKAGNTRFANGTMRHAHEASNWRKHLTEGQQPFATIVGCSDSRVPIELVFDQGFGDLFVIRIAGNVIGSSVVGSLQYAAYHLKTSLFVVMGHEGCGGVAATLEAIDGTAREPRFIQELAGKIKPGLAGLDPSLKGPARLSAAVEANVRWAVRQLSEIPEARKALDDNVFTLIGAVYDIATGQVRYLD